IEENTSIITAEYQDDVRPYFALADALVFPSYREGFPNVVLQAGAMELPSIVSNINGCNEIIKEGENGLIIPVKNTSELQKAIRKLLTDEPLYDHLKKNARPRIVQHYEQAVVWQALLEEYRNTENHV
ncbi:glycosyltransferase, partial [Kaistella carnis]